MDTKVKSLIDNLFNKCNYNSAYELVNSITIDHVMAGCENNLVNTQCAVLKVSNGDIEKLKKAVSCAKKDFRDVILWASKLQ